jgi:hypothetical protein
LVGQKSDIGAWRLLKLENMRKPITDFSGYAAGDLLPAAVNIHDQLVLNIALFPGLPSTPADLKLLNDAFEAAMAKKVGGARADFLAFEVARANLEGALGDTGAYVNIVAKGDPTTVSASGFPSYDTGGNTPDYSPPAAPTNVVVRQGVISGSYVSRFRAARRRSVNEAQTCTGDPNAETNWKPAGIFHGGKATLTGYEPGTTVWSRFRTIGLNNVMGAWSDPLKIMVV